jgi:hypothetical protein
MVLQDDRFLAQVMSMLDGIWARCRRNVKGPFLSNLMKRDRIVVKV